MDCTGSDVCQAGKCVAQHCDDGAMGGQETDVDCGGVDCNACSDHEACELDSDCRSIECDSVLGACEPPRCDDGAKNGSETDSDCGGWLVPFVGAAIVYAALRHEEGSGAPELPLDVDDDGDEDDGQGDSMSDTGPAPGAPDDGG